MGPEAKNVLPSAINFKKKLWRPIAALAVMLSVAVVYDESQPLVNPERTSAQNYLTLPQEHTKDLHSHEDLSQKLSGSIIISKPYEEQNEKRDLIMTRKLKLDKQRLLENAPESSVVSQSDDNLPILSRITGYYCRQVPGYPVGDGGGYCEGTSSGEELRAEDSAACSEKWPEGTILQIEGYKQVKCVDAGYLAWDQVDVWFPTNKDLEDSNKPQWAKITVVENLTE